RRRALSHGPAIRVEAKPGPLLRPARGRQSYPTNALPHRKVEMLWPHARFRRARNVDLQERVAAARRETPESDAWLKLLEAALGESEDGAVWDAAVPEPAAERPVKAPVLSHAHITLNGRAARRGRVHRPRAQAPAALRPLRCRMGDSPAALRVLRRDASRQPRLPDARGGRADAQDRGL